MRAIELLCVAEATANQPNSTEGDTHCVWICGSDNKKNGQGGRILMYDVGKEAEKNKKKERQEKKLWRRPRQIRFARRHSQCEAPDNGTTTPRVTL